MKIDECKYVSMKYKLSLESGEVADASPEDEPLGFIVGANQIIPGLERGIRGMEPGQTARIRVEAAEGYGEHRSDLIREIPRENFPADAELEPGMGFEARGPFGPVLFRVESIAGENVRADFNHPLAGATLFFDVSIQDVRDPSPEELASAEAPSCSSGCAECGGGCASSAAA